MLPADMIKFTLAALVEWASDDKIYTTMNKNGMMCGIGILRALQPSAGQARSA